ncbi:RNA 2',3'-cyclic phosphodiesterase [Jeotgalibacillus proteolyticus]|nr:RNA 2',3'-cyclic phosphodiesterase [Jeotgalibacillus proteolyticus]
MTSSHYFIAIEFSPADKEKIDAIKTEWKDKLVFKQWTHKMDVHLTLAFLGAVNDTDLGLYKNYLKEVLTPLKREEITIERADTFGKSDSPRILWIGPETTEGLQEIYNHVQQAVKKAGGTTEKRPFRPHITLAKNWQGEGAFKLPHGFEPFKTKISSVCLYRIHPKESPKYEVVSQFRLS